MFFQAEIIGVYAKRSERKDVLEILLQTFQQFEKRFSIFNKLFLHHGKMHLVWNQQTRYNKSAKLRGQTALKFYAPL